MSKGNRKEYVVHQVEKLIISVLSERKIDTIQYISFGTCKFFYIWVTLLILFFF